MLHLVFKQFLDKCKPRVVCPLKQITYSMPNYEVDLENMPWPSSLRMAKELQLNLTYYITAKKIMIGQFQFKTAIITKTKPSKTRNRNADT